jgi:F-type H+-transporting ATPase subunit epsilon
MAEAAGQTGLAKDFLLEVVTPEKQLVSERVVAVRAPGIAGEFGVLPSHERLITALGTGLLRYKLRENGEDWIELPVSAGLVEVLPDRVIILAQTAEMPRAIDVQRAEAARDRARERLAHPEEDTDIERAVNALQRADVRLQAARGETSES